MGAVSGHRPDISPMSGRSADMGRHCPQLVNGLLERYTACMPRTLDPVPLRVYDVGHPNGMRFDAVIGHPETIRVAHHRDARGVVELLGADQTMQEDLWETREYALEEVGPDRAWARYEPTDWQTMTQEEIDRRETLSRPPSRTREIWALPGTGAVSIAIGHAPRENF